MRGYRAEARASKCSLLSLGVRSSDSPIVVATEAELLYLSRALTKDIAATEARSTSAAMSRAAKPGPNASRSYKKQQLTNPSSEKRHQRSPGPPLLLWLRWIQGCCSLGGERLDDDAPLPRRAMQLLGQGPDAAEALLDVAPLQAAPPDPQAGHGRHDGGKQRPPQVAPKVALVELRAPPGLVPLPLAARYLVEGLLEQQRPEERRLSHQEQRSTSFVSKSDLTRSPST